MLWISGGALQDCSRSSVWEPLVYTIMIILQKICHDNAIHYDETAKGQLIIRKVLLFIILSTLYLKVNSILLEIILFNPKK